MKMQNQSFRVQVWASHENDAQAAELAQDLRDRVRQAVIGSRAAIDAGETFTARTDGKGEHSFHFAIQRVVDVKPVDYGETLVVTFVNGKTERVRHFEQYNSRTEKRDGELFAVGYDYTETLLNGAKMQGSKVYAVGRYGVRSIRIERGARRG